MADSAAPALWTEILTRFDEFLLVWQASSSPRSNPEPQSLSTEKRLQCYTLFRYWYENNDYPQNHADYGRRLGPLLCQNVEQQSRFEKCWRQFWQLAEPKPAQKTIHLRQPQNTWFEQGNVQLKKHRRRAIAILVLLLVSAGIWLTSYLSPAPVPQTVVEDTVATPPPPQTQGEVATTAETPTTSTRPYLKTVPLRQPPPWLELGANERARLSEFWYWRILPLTLAVWLSIAALFWWIRRVMFKTLRQRDSEPIPYRLPLSGFDNSIIPGLKNVVARLRFQPVSKRPDWPKTSRASARQPGFPVLHYKARQRQIDYVMVLDVRHASDQAAWLIRYLRDELRKAQLVVHYYDFDYYPDVLWSGGDRTRQPIPLAQLASLHPDSRLLLMVEHEVVFYRLSGATQHWLRQLEHWPDYLLALLSQPTPAQQRTLNLAGHTYRVLTTQDHLSDVLNAIGAPPAQLPPQPIPEFLRQSDQLWQLEKEQIQPLLRQLKDYLGDDGFRLFAGIAMYPKLHGDLTYYLYQTLAAEPALSVSPAALLKVVSLPWCRQGSLPEWLRRASLNALADGDYRFLRQFYCTLFSAKDKLPTIDQLRLDIHRPPPPELRRWIKAALNKAEPGEFSDNIFAKVLLTPRWNTELRLPGRQTESVLPRKVINKLVPALQLAATGLALFALAYGGWQFYGKDWYGEQLLNDKLAANHQITVTVQYHDNAYPLLEPLGQGLYALGYQPALQSNNELRENRITAPPHLISELERMAKYMSWGETFTLDSEGENPVIEIASLPQTGAVFQDALSSPVHVSRHYPTDGEDFWLDTEDSSSTTPPADPATEDKAAVEPILPKMMPIPAGSFMMGSPADEPDRYDDEGPQHQVTLNAFELAEAEVTFAEWDRCVQAGACREVSDSGWGRENRPVINVSWDDTQTYIDWLNQTQGLSGNNGYRLPTEAEWEYAARAGTTSAYYWGDGLQCDYANSSISTCSDGFNVTAPVKSFKPNDWGLYDMSGNVWEWTADCWHDNYEGAPTDGSAWRNIGNDFCYPVLRGSSWDVEPRYLRSAVRNYDWLARVASLDIGFRLARTP